jgi:hypothetical protein
MRRQQAARAPLGKARPIDSMMLVMDKRASLRQVDAKSAEYKK